MYKIDLGGQIITETDNNKIKTGNTAYITLVNAIAYHMVYGSDTSNLPPDTNALTSITKICLVDDGGTKRDCGTFNWNAVDETSVSLSGTADIVTTADYTVAKYWVYSSTDDLYFVSTLATTYNVVSNQKVRITMTIQPTVNSATYTISSDAGDTSGNVTTYSLDNFHNKLLHILKGDSTDLDTIKVNSLDLAYNGSSVGLSHTFTAGTDTTYTTAKFTADWTTAHPTSDTTINQLWYKNAEATPVQIMDFTIPDTTIIGDLDNEIKLEITFVYTSSA